MRERVVEGDDAAGRGADKMDFFKPKAVKKAMKVFGGRDIERGGLRPAMPAAIVGDAAIARRREDAGLVKPHRRAAGAGVQEDDRRAVAARVLEPDARARNLRNHSVLF